MQKVPAWALFSGGNSSEVEASTRRLEKVRSLVLEWHDGNGMLRARQDGAEVVIKDGLVAIHSETVHR